MAISEEQVKAFEDEYKKVLFSEIDSLITSQNQLFSTLKRNQEPIGINKDLPNIGITFNNKLIELSHIFQEAGLSMYSSKIENSSLLNSNGDYSSFVGHAIIFDITHTIAEAIDILLEYNSELNRLYDERIKKFKAYENSNIVYVFPKYGERYHDKTCRYISYYESERRYIRKLDREDAYRKGYTPCIVCQGAAYE